MTTTIATQTSKRPATYAELKRQVKEVLFLGLERIRVLSAPKHLYGISGFGLEITEYVED